MDAAAPEDTAIFSHAARRYAGVIGSRPGSWLAKKGIVSLREMSVDG